MIDDGSDDGTSDSAGELPCTVVRHARNRGKGAALRSGFKASLEDGFRFIFTIDADAQHDPVLMPLFYKELSDKNLDIVLGNRMHGDAGMPRDRYISNKWSSALVSRLCRITIPDSQCGYRLIKAEVLKSITLRTEHFETETELLIKAARLKYSIGSVEIPIRYCGSSSSIRRLKDTIRFLTLIVDLLAHRGVV